MTPYMRTFPFFSSSDSDSMDTRFLFAYSNFCGSGFRCPARIGIFAAHRLVGITPTQRFLHSPLNWDAAHFRFGFIYFCFYALRVSSSSVIDVPDSDDELDPPKGRVASSDAVIDVSDPDDERKPAKKARRPESQSPVLLAPKRSPVSTAAQAIARSAKTVVKSVKRAMSPRTSVASSCKATADVMIPTAFAKNYSSATSAPHPNAVASSSRMNAESDRDSNYDDGFDYDSEEGSLEEGTCDQDDSDWEESEEEEEANGKPPVFTQRCNTLQYEETHKHAEKTSSKASKNDATPDSLKYIICHESGGFATRSSDVADPNSTRHLLRHATRKFLRGSMARSNGRLKGLVLILGGAVPSDMPLAKVLESQVIKMIKIHVRAMHFQEVDFMDVPGFNNPNINADLVDVRDSVFSPRSDKAVRGGDKLVGKFEGCRAAERHGGLGKK
ncbi:hypothetical protein C8R44DRAFT_728510 [Mycena epipterygia]|nr:hypothetical protein C8R44DRAFT_728510 [Mycena epipterygia]